MIWKHRSSATRLGLLAKVEGSSRVVADRRQDRELCGEAARVPASSRSHLRHEDLKIILTKTSLQTFTSLGRKEQV